MSPRPTTLCHVAERSDSLEDFGRHFRDWLHELRQWSSRPRVARAVRDEPPLLAGKFAGGGVADAWLAAYAEEISRRLARPAPAWAAGQGRVSAEPWFATTSPQPALRWAALRDSPGPFKRRNLYTAEIDLPLALRAGRPAKDDAEKRRGNAERQRRFRARRRADWRRLQALLAGR